MADDLEPTSMPPSSPVAMVTGNPVLRGVGSLWFAAVLLMLFLVAMACATVCESIHTAERAVAIFYTSWWFKTILTLIAANVLASMVVRYPFSKRQIGFLLTHTGILVTLGGALVTDRFGVGGQIGLFEGESVEAFNARIDALTVANRRDPARASVDLTARTFSGFRAVDQPDAPPLTLDELRIEVERFLPDGEWAKRVLDDNRNIQPAVEVSLSASGVDDPAWLFAGKTETFGAAQAIFRLALSKAELVRLLSESSEDRSGSSGLVKVEYGGSTYEIPLEEGLEKAVPLGDSGATIRVLRYMPHANVGSDNQVVNISDQPLNPAIEAEIVGPAGTEKRLAFANFPDFQSMHDKPQVEGFKLTFIAPSEAVSRVPVEVIADPKSELYVRFDHEGDTPQVHKLEIGIPVQSPWPDKQFAVLRRFEHARLEWTIKAVKPMRKERKPALLLNLSTTEHTNRMWVQKYAPRPVTVNDVPYELVYGNKQVSLGFALTLDRFRVSSYPGSMKPRSFESHVTLTDSTTGRTLSRVISMNHPVEYGGYALFQSSYQQGAQRTASFLSVSRDPGQPVAFAGYIVMLLGMVVVLGMRVSDRRNAKP